MFNILIVYCYESDNGIEFLDIQAFSLRIGTLKAVISDGIWIPNLNSFPSTMEINNPF